MTVGRDVPRENMKEDSNETFGKFLGFVTNKVGAKASLKLKPPMRIFMFE